MGSRKEEGFLGRGGRGRGKLRFDGGKGSTTEVVGLSCACLQGRRWRRRRVAFATPATHAPFGICTIGHTSHRRVQRTLCPPFPTLGYPCTPVFLAHAFKKCGSVVVHLGKGEGVAWLASSVVAASATHSPHAVCTTNLTHLQQHRRRVAGKGGWCMTLCLSSPTHIHTSTHSTPGPVLPARGC